MSTIREDLLPQPGELIADHYEIESLLGHGGMGAVFAARHTRTGRAVAIKWMLPQAATSDEAVARFIAEAKATARIEHPNVVHIYDFGESRGSPFLVMERLRGRSLRAHLEHVGRLTAAEAIHLLVPAMRGVGEAHREGIIHRDIKPDNIFLCRGKDGSPREAKVVDFGISKLYDSEDMSNLTGTGMMMGTPAYMSPEQLNAPREARATFDVYAFGVVFYEALTGRKPYVADGIFRLIAEIMKADVAPPSQLVPEIPADLDACVLRAMHREGSQRFGSMAEMIAAFDACRVLLGPAALASSPWSVLSPHPLEPWDLSSTPSGQTSRPGIEPLPSPAPRTPAGVIQVTARLPVGPASGQTSPTAAALGPVSSSGAVEGTPGTPHGFPPLMSHPRGRGRAMVLGGLALMLGGVCAAVAAFFLAGGDRTPAPDPGAPAAGSSTTVVPSPVEPSPPAGSVAVEVPAPEPLVDPSPSAAERDPAPEPLVDPSPSAVERRPVEAPDPPTGSEASAEEPPPERPVESERAPAASPPRPPTDRLPRGSRRDRRASPPRQASPVAPPDSTRSSRPAAAQRGANGALIIE